MPFGERYIWGVTAGILRNLYDRIYRDRRMIRPASPRSLLFLAPFVLYAAFLLATRAGVLDREVLADATRHAGSASSRCVLVIGSFVYLAHFSGAPVGTSYVPAHIENGKSCPGRASERRPTARKLDAGLAHARARCRGLLAVLDRDGEEARVVGGAVRNALLGEPVARDRHRHHRGAGRGRPARDGGRLQGGADRHRARHRDGRRRRRSRSR